MGTPGAVGDGRCVEMVPLDLVVACPVMATPIDPEEELVWVSFDVGAGPPHPEGKQHPSGWTCAQLAADDGTVLAHVWVGTIHTRVVADFTFDPALGGDVDEAVFPLLVEGFFGDDGHTLGHYRYPAYGSVDFTNLRTGASWAVSWDTMDEEIAEMKHHAAYVARSMR
jgi:hypothetical protein